MTTPTPINSPEEFEAALTSAQEAGKVIVAKFGAPWCAPCKKIAPFFKDFAKKFGGIVFLDIDYDENEDLADEWNVDKLPMFLVIKDGEEQSRLQNSDPALLQTLIEQQHKDVAQEQIADAFSMDAEF